MALTGKEQIAILPQTAIGGPAPTSQVVTTNDIAALANSGQVITNPTITGGTADNMIIGGTTAVAGTFTLLTATGTVALSPANKAVTLAPTGTGVVTISPASAGTIDRMTIGGTTPAAGKFTTVTVTSDDGLVLTGQTTDAGAAVATMTNGPTAGDPAFWLRISVNGTNLAVPAWTAV